ncbi:MAG: hypothetical protein M3442_04935 [Chloroflexota bacterium]|nr:hypothetical protein [Chloroflexota bacterium]
MAPREVITVQGPVPAAALGQTMAHEHVFFDLRCYFSQSDDDPDGALAAAPVVTERLWWLRAHPMNSRANLVHADLETAVAEVGAFASAGGGTLVDVTTTGIAPHPLGLAEVARRTGVHIVAGTGFYTGPSYVAQFGDWSTDQFTDHMRRELEEGIGGTSVRAGMIGELGIADPPLPVELRVVAAAARLQQERDYAVTLHPAWGPEGALRAARVAEDAGLDPRRTSICHLDNRLRDDLALFKELAARGFYLNLDCFGRELYYPHVNAQLPSDAERIRTLIGVLDAGYADRLLLAQDICFTHELVCHGGHGYAHVLRTVRPRLLRSGVEPTTIETLLVQNPRAWLSGERA